MSVATMNLPSILVVLLCVLVSQVVLLLSWLEYKYKYKYKRVF
jgi:hypothetical protein